MIEQGPAIADRTPIFALLGANAVSQVGNMMTSVAVPWFVLETTGSAAKTGLTAAAIGMGSVLPSVLGGPLVDRLGFKRTSVIADLASGATVATIPLLYLAGVLAFWQLPLLVFLFSSINTNGDTARLALIPTLARRATMPIDRANSADRAIARLGQLVGPVVAGVLIVLIGASNVLFVHAATFSVSAALIALGVSSAASASAEAEAQGTRGYLSELLAGLRFVRTNALLLSIILVAMVANSLDIPLLQVILPVYAKTFYGSAASLGIVLGALAAGALAGTLLFGALGHRLPSRRLTFITCFVTGPLLVYAALAATPPLAVVVAAGALGGLIAGPITPLYATIIQENTPPQMLGRVFGALNALAQAGIPLGAALAGFVVEGVGLVPTILGMGAIYLVVTFGMYLNPALRRMDAGKEQ